MITAKNWKKTALKIVVKFEEAVAEDRQHKTYVH